MGKPWTIISTFGSVDGQYPNMWLKDEIVIYTIIWIFSSIVGNKLLFEHLYYQMFCNGCAWGQILIKWRTLAISVLNPGGVSCQSLFSMCIGHYE